jgi:nitrate reductase delta subunit
MSKSKIAGTEQGLALAQLGQLLDYPSGDYVGKVKSLISSVSDNFPKTKAALEKFQQFVEESSLAHLEETYTRTFDLAALCSLYVTGYLFGDENFDRGSLMAVLAGKYEEYGFEKGGELPDFLPLMLKFTAYLSIEELDELVQFCLKEPVAQMLKQLHDSKSSYASLFQGIELVLHAGGGK